MEYLGRNLVGRTIGCIDHNAQAMQGQLVIKGALAEFDIAARSVAQALRLAQLR